MKKKATYRCACFFFILVYAQVGFATNCQKENIFYWNNNNGSWLYNSTLYHYPNQNRKDTLQLEWDTTLNSNFHRYRYLYNAQGQETFFSAEFSSASNPNWIFTNKRVSTYDTNGNLISKRNYSSQFTSLILHDSIGYIYTYDNLHPNRIVTKLFRNYAPQIGYYPDTKDSSIYGPNGEIVELITSTYNATTQNWELQSRKINFNYINSIYDKPISYEGYSFVNSTWQLAVRNSFQYLSNSGLITTVQTWDIGANNYENSVQLTSRFDSCMHQNSYRYNHWNPTLQSWITDAANIFNLSYGQDSCTLSSQIDIVWDYNQLMYLNQKLHEFSDYSSYIGLSEAGQNFEFNLFPNPSVQETVSFQFSLAQVLTVHVDLYNSLGEKIKSNNYQKLLPGNHTENMDISGVPIGIYTLLFQAGTHQFSKKLIRLANK